MAEEKKKKRKSDTRLDSGETVDEIVSEQISMKKKKKKNRETKDGFDGEIAERESEKLGEDVVVKKKKKKSKKQRIDSEAEDDGNNKEKMADSEPELEDGVKKKSKKKHKETNVDSEAEVGVKKKKKKRKKESVSDVIGNSESSKVCDTDDANKKKGKRKRDDCDLGAQENRDKEMKRKSKKKKHSVDSEVEETSLNSKKHIVDSEAEDNNLTSTKDAKKKKRKKKKKQSEASEAEENNNDGKVAKRKRKKQESGKGDDKDVTTPSSKSTKKVKFSDKVDIFEDEEEEEEEEEEVELVRGKRYTKEEDELIRKSVSEYVDNHALGDNGIDMVMHCKSHPQLKGCWKEIASALPWRVLGSVYHRAHTLFEEGSRGIWTKEDFELLVEFQKKHGNDWRTIADVMGKSRKHVKDAWRRIRLEAKNKGHWTRQEYQNLFDLVNKDIKTKAFQEKHSKHGMLKDNIPWMAISDVLETRDHVSCCTKWYDQLTSPMVAKGIWANADDYRLVDELLKLDAACIDDVDWDNLLENRDGDACRKRWNQMVLHIGLPKSKTFAEQVEILSERYCPDLAEDREDFDNRPYDPED